MKFFLKMKKVQLSIVLFCLCFFASSSFVNSVHAVTQNPIDAIYLFSATTYKPNGVVAGGVVHVTGASGLILPTPPRENPVLDCGTLVHPAPFLTPECHADMKSISDLLMGFTATADPGSIVSDISVSYMGQSITPSCFPALPNNFGKVQCSVQFHYSDAWDPSLPAAGLLNIDAIIVFDKAPTTGFGYFLSATNITSLQQGLSGNSTILASLTNVTTKKISLTLESIQNSSGMNVLGTGNDQIRFVSFSPASITPAASSILTIQAGPSVPFGTYTGTVVSNTAGTGSVLSGRCDVTVETSGVGPLTYTNMSNCSDNLGNVYSMTFAQGNSKSAIPFALLDQACGATNSSWITIAGIPQVTSILNGTYTCNTPRIKASIDARSASFYIEIVTNLPPPTNLIASTSICAQPNIVTPLTLSWTAPNPNNTIGYNIYRDGVYFDSAISATTTYSTTTPGTAGFSYLFSIKAAYIGNESAAATTTSIAIASCPVINTFNYSLSAPALIQIVKGQTGTIAITKTLISGQTQEVVLSLVGAQEIQNVAGLVPLISDKFALMVSIGLPPGATIVGISKNSGVSSYPGPTSNSVVTINTGTALAGSYNLSFIGTSVGIPDKSISFYLQIINGASECTAGLTLVNGVCINNITSSPNPNPLLWITNTDGSTTTAKRIRLNQSATLGWLLPTGWTGCVTDTTPPNPTIVGWNSAPIPNFVSSSTASLNRLSNAGEFIMKIICGASSTKPIKLIVVDPNGGER